MTPQSIQIPRSKNQYITAVVANAAGNIFDLTGYAAVGADGPCKKPLSRANTCNLPHGTELMFLPDRQPVLYNIVDERIETLAVNPYIPDERIFPVAAFNSPGYVNTYSCAYIEAPTAGYLPLFAYGAVGWFGGKFRSAAIQVDDEPRQDLRRMPLEKVHAGVRRMQRQLPGNRLCAHLEKCALTYGCPAGKNFFLGRYEAPLPTARTCNARCLGCISLQADKTMPCSQERIGFTPTPDEIAQVALAHIQRVNNSVVSFGQGCEGDPLLEADTIAAAIRKIRVVTEQGTINMNTNGSLPRKLEKLFDAGLDSIRVSMNSVRPATYEAYFRPSGYGFKDVLHSIDLALARSRHVAINYLNCPGFTDTPEEYEALTAFLRDHHIHMIQWRNLNFDPLRYLQAMQQTAHHSPPMGMENLLQQIHRHFPGLRFGYFNPPKASFNESRKRFLRI